MRRAEFAMTRDDAVALLRGAEVMHLCGVGEDGAPIFKTVHGVVVDEWLCFHSSPKGEKTSLVGRPVVATVEQTVARIPSTFLDPLRACPATTLFRSVQVHGVLEALEVPALKARALQALMDKLQPQGGYVPITEGEPLYTAQLRGLLIAGVRLDRLDGKAKLAQNRSERDRHLVEEQLWRRGDLDDPQAVELIRGANPGDAPPPFLQGPATLRGWLPNGRALEAAHLLERLYWNQGTFTVDELVRAHLGSTAWVGATEGQRLIASARAISDGGKYAWVYDVVVADDWKGKGVGQALMRLLLDHPRVRHAKRVLLATRDAQTLYAKFGFVDRTQAAVKPHPGSTEMVLVRLS
jgi:GNAT superfamily N-acetyltransferase/nitroimidazol reductase NimA-like FMN-containing flavoprotein (pyridoxamine 5'-phosphate oxidase superfamily)